VLPKLPYISLGFEKIIQFSSHTYWGVQEKDNKKPKN